MGGKSFAVSTTYADASTHEFFRHITIFDPVSGETIHDTCHILIGGNGLLNSWKFPEEVEGLQDFKGKLFHSARWPHEYGPDQWANDRVAVLGSGASAIQIVPTLQPRVKQMDVFMRTPVWFAEIAGHSGVNHDCKAGRGDLESTNANAKCRPTRGTTEAQGRH